MTFNVGQNQENYSFFMFFKIQMTFILFYFYLPQVVFDVLDFEEKGTSNFQKIRRSKLKNF